MSWLTQPRTLDIAGAALPAWRDMPLFTVSRLSGVEKLGRLYDYTVELATVEIPGLYVREVQALVQIDHLVGTEVTLSIAIEGSGTYAAGMAGIASASNQGAGVRKLTSVVSEAQCVGADERRAFYRLRLRPWLWLATLTRDSRIFQDCTVVEISETILNAYPYVYETRLAGPGFGRQYPRRDYQRQFWESDWQFLDRLWQEWGITFYYESGRLILCDSPGAYRKHGPAYERLRYLGRGGQRIDEEHVHQFEVARSLTTGKVTLTDYDYTRSLAKLAVNDSDRRERANDNAEEYGWGDYAQPLAGSMGLSGDPNDVRFEAEHLARVRLEAHRAKSLRARGKGNLRGLMTGYTFHLEGYPLVPGDGEYLVTSTKIEIVNNDTVTNRGVLNPQYSVETRFTAQPANTFFRTPQKAKKPRSYGEIAVVTAPEKYPLWTDRYGRVLVRFVWERTKDRKEHYTSCWLRVSSPWQGAGYGAIWIPRVGHEVEIGYHDNDPDKPFVVGRLTNEFHEPPWKLPDNQALSGWRSQDLGGRSNAANSVMTDDTPGKLQVQVASDQAQSRLVLGYNTRIDGHAGRSTPRGEGFELATDAWGVVRANKGMLVTTETRAGAMAPVKDMDETLLRLTQAREQHEDLAQLARQHRAQDAQVSQREATQAIKTQNDAVRGSVKAHDDPSPEMTRPDLLLASAAGIATSATDSTHQASLNDHAVTVGRDYSLSAGHSYHASVRGSISLFAYQDGMKFYAARGRVEIQAQGDEMALAALKDLTISSTDGKIFITASKEVWIGAGGSYIQINGGGITNGSPGPILEKTPSWDVPAADSKRVPLPVMPVTPLRQNPMELYSQTFDVSTVAANQGDGLTLGNQPYRIYLPDGTLKQQGMLSDGATLTVSTPEPVKVKCEIGAGDWGVIEDAYDHLHFEDDYEHG